MIISECFVWKWLMGESEPVVAGRLVQNMDGQQIFTYGRSYIERHNAESIYSDELPLINGVQTPFVGLSEFACIRDTSPDAWGRRVVINRMFAVGEDVKGKGFYDRELSEITYLLESASDRVGSLDFQLSSTEYVARCESEASIEDLYLATQKVLDGLPIPPSLEMALMHGTSLGGARPKSMLSGEEKKYIAKFSTSTDPYNVVKSEYIAMKLAKLVGIDVADVALGSVFGRDYLLVTRFDRKLISSGNWARRSVVSALTVLELHERWVKEASYLDLIEKIRINGTVFKVQSMELFRRIVFNVLIGNTDDHARNHAFFIKPGDELELTPAYDLCPQPRAGGEATHGMLITKNKRFSRLSDVLSTCERYGLTEQKAKAEIERMAQVVFGAYQNLAVQCSLDVATRNMLWRGAILNRDIFYGGFEYLNEKVENF